MTGAELSTRPIASAPAAAAELAALLILVVVSVVCACAPPLREAFPEAHVRALHAGRDLFARGVAAAQAGVFQAAEQLAHTLGQLGRVVFDAAVHVAGAAVGDRA